MNVQLDIKNMYIFEKSESEKAVKFPRNSIQKVNQQ